MTIEQPTTLAADLERSFMSASRRYRDGTQIVRDVLGPRVEAILDAYLLVRDQ